MRSKQIVRRALNVSCGASLLVAGALGAQGLSYDMSTTASGPDRTGAVSTRNMMAAHGQFASGNSRIDVTQSMSPGGMMGQGTYMITNGSKGTVTSVDPAKHQYTVIDIAELGKTANDMQAALGGMAKIEVANVKVDVQDLGAGEPLDGYATWKYRISQSYTMNMTVMGHDDEHADAIGDRCVGGSAARRAHGPERSSAGRDDDGTDGRAHEAADGRLHQNAEGAHAQTCIDDGQWRGCAKALDDDHDDDHEREKVGDQPERVRGAAWLPEGGAHGRGGCAGCGGQAPEARVRC